MLHGGWGADHSYLLDALRGLENELHLVFYDQRGSLRSQCDVEQISVAAHAEDLNRVREQLRLDRVHLFAHSNGAFLASRYLRDHPDHVGHLVFAAPALIKRPLDETEEALWTPTSEAAEFLQSRPAVAEELKALDLPAAEDRNARERTQAWRLRFASVNIYHVNRWQLLRGGGVFYSTEAAQAAGMDMDNEFPWDFRGTYRKHDYPVTIIMGDHDFVDLGATVYRHWFEDDDHVELHVLEEAGHNLWLDQPDSVRQLLRQAMTVRQSQ